MLDEPRGAVRVKEVEIDEPGPGEALIRLEACGICHSDLFVAGLEKLPLAPVTLGHEGIGTVKSVGPEVAGWAPGDRAGITFLAETCGGCEWCRSGRERFCPKQTNFGYTRNGALAQFALAPAGALVRVPADLAAAAAAPLCCAGWTALGALREANLTAGQQVALFGFGGLGHLALQMAHARKLRVVVADISDSKLEMAKAGGAEMAVPAGNAGRALQKEYGGIDAALVLTPAPTAIQEAFRALKRGGTLVLVGIAAARYELPLLDTVLKGVTVRGSYLGNQRDLAEVFELAAAGAVRAHVHIHALDETPDLLDRLQRGEIPGRAVVQF